MNRVIPSPVGLRAATAALGAKLKPYAFLLNSKSMNHDFGVKLTPCLFRLNFESRNHDFRSAFPLAWTKVYSTTCSSSNLSSPCDDATNSIEKNEVDASLRAATELAMNSVVKIFTLSKSSDYLLPWQTMVHKNVTASGFVIFGRRILTNAHVVADHMFIRVQKHHSLKKYRAEVQAIGHECDLAILTVDNEEFWEGLNFLEFGTTPYLQNDVFVVGYSRENISVTQAVVSRIEQIQYRHAVTELLAIQIQAGIEKGCIGGPALMDGKVIGVAFQDAAYNIGCLIPIPVVKHFISSIEETGKYIGFCSLDLSWQPIKNEKHLEKYKMPADLTGVRVSRINRLSGAYGVLKVDDIILSFDGSTIANNGTVHFRDKDRITFDHLVSMKKPNDSALVKVLRDGEEHEFVVSLRPKQHLIPVHEYDKHPSYFIFGGLVFTPLTIPFIRRYKNYWGGERWWTYSMDRASKQQLRKDGQQIVILSFVLIDDINTDYEYHHSLPVKKVNRIKVHNLKHMRELVEDGSKKNVRIDLDEEKVIIFNRREAQMANSRVLKRYRICSALSDDLVDKNIASHPDMEFS